MSAEPKTQGIIANVLNWTNDYNSLVGAISLAATVAGFAWTLIKLYLDRQEMSKAQVAIQAAQDKTKVAVEKAQEDIEATKLSVQEIKSNLFRFDAISEISSTVTALAEIRRMQIEDSDNWTMVLERYGTVRHSLVQVNTVVGLFDEAQKATVQESVVQLKTLHEKILKAVVDKEPPRNVASISRVLSEQIDELGIILTQLKNMDWETNV